MLSFKDYVNKNILLKESFSGLPDIEVYNLDKFIKKQNVKTEEIEEADDEAMLGAKHSIPSDSEIQDYLDRVMRGEKTTREKYVMPYVHNTLLKKVPGDSIIIDADGKHAMDVDKNQKVDVEALKKELTVRPPEILSQNEKAKKSGGKYYVFFNFGIPALTGLAVDEKSNKFVIVNTCPGAGQCKLYCYALKGSYVQYPAVYIKQTRMLNYLLNDPHGFFKQLSNEIQSAKNKFSKKGYNLIIRWHDAGDFFSDTYRNMFFDVVKKFPDVEFYAYTKLAKGVTGSYPDNFTINFSQGALPTQQKQVDTTKYKHSSVVPKELFSDLVKKIKITNEKGKTETIAVFKDKKSQDTFKERLAKKYDLDVSTILTYDEMMDTPKSSDKNKYNVIVVPGQGDVSASRKDVLGTYLLIH